MIRENFIIILNHLFWFEHTVLRKIFSFYLLKQILFLIRAASSQGLQFGTAD